MKMSRNVKTRAKMGKSVSNEFNGWSTGGSRKIQEVRRAHLVVVVVVVVMVVTVVMVVAALEVAQSVAVAWYLKLSSPVTNCLADQLGVA
jgi:hypothetical protein